MILNDTKNMSENDIYFMDSLRDRLVINDNYKGVLILDIDLKLLKKIEICEGLIIERAIKKNYEILLICLENEKIIYINSLKYTYKIIPLDEYKNIIFSDFFEWNDKEVVLLDYKGNLIKLDLNTFQLQVIDDVKKMDFSIQKIYDQLRKFYIQKVFLSEKKVIVIKTSNRLELLDYTNGINSIIEFTNDNYYDFELYCNFMVAISEEKILIINLQSGECQCHFSKNGYRFLRGKFFLAQQTMCLFLLSGNKKNVCETVIEKFVVI